MEFDFLVIFIAYNLMNKGKKFYDFVLKIQLKTW